MVAAKFCAAGTALPSESTQVPGNCLNVGCILKSGYQKYTAQIRAPLINFEINRLTMAKLRWAGDILRILK